MKFYSYVYMCQLCSTVLYTLQGHSGVVTHGPTRILVLYTYATREMWKKKVVFETESKIRGQNVPVYKKGGPFWIPLGHLGVVFQLLYSTKCIQ